MRLAFLMALQAAPVAGPPLPVELRPIKPLADASRCGEPDDAGEIVVCGRARDSDRLPRLDTDRYARAPMRASTAIGKVRMAAEAEQGALPNGQSSPRAMLRLKLPF